MNCVCAKGAALRESSASLLLGVGSPDLLVPAVWGHCWAEFAGLCSACSHEGAAQHSTEILSHLQEL